MLSLFLHTISVQQYARLHIQQVATMLVARGRIAAAALRIILILLTMSLPSVL